MASNDRAELHKTIWKIANDLRGSVDGWDFKAGELKTAGTAVTKLLPAKNMFSAGAEHALQKAFVIDRLKAFFERFANL